MEVPPRVMEHLETLVEFPTCREEGMHRCAAYLKDELERIGYTASTDRVSNVFAQREYSGGNGLTFLVNTHFDTVSENERWTKDPFKVAVEGDRAYGLGTSDSKGSIASALNTLEQLGKSRFSRIAVLFSNYEDNNVSYEGRTWLGTEFFLTHNKLTAAYGINVEGTVEKDRFLVSVGCGGRVGFYLTTIGVEAHSSDPRKGRNAIYDMMKVIQALRTLPPATMRLDECEVYTELNVSKIGGGTVINIVPGSCLIECERRVLVTETWDEVKRGIESVLQGIKDVNMKVEYRRAQHPYYVEPSHEAVIRAREAVHSIVGYVPNLKVEAGRTDSTYIHELSGIKTVILGPGEVAHIADEYVNLKRLEEFSRILSKMLT